MRHEQIKPQVGEIWFFLDPWNQRNPDNDIIIIGSGPRHTQWMTLDGKRRSQAAHWHINQWWQLAGSII